MSARFECNGNLQERQAAAILQPFVEVCYQSFLNAGLDRLEDMVIRVTGKAHDQERHFAAASTDGNLILLAPQLIELPTETASGIIAHEFGHAADFSYPAQWVKTAGGKMKLADISRQGSRADDAFPKEWLRDWRARDDDAIERSADAIAESVLGRRIGYSGSCMLQTIGRGVRPRPEGLR